MFLIHRKIPQEIFQGKQILDIGCGRNKLPGAVGLDHNAYEGVDIVANLEQPLPVTDSEYDLVFANQVLEHVDNLIELVYEAYRILKPGGVFLIHVPYFRSSWAHIDPTHVRSFTINSMDYFVKGTYCYENYRFRDIAFDKIEVFLDNDYKSTMARRLFSSKALKDPFKFENSFWSNFYPFEQISYLMTK
jgi:SAM-dependent methyltransferase